MFSFPETSIPYFFTELTKRLMGTLVRDCPQLSMGPMSLQKKYTMPQRQPQGKRRLPLLDLGPLTCFRLSSMFSAHWRLQLPPGAASP